MKTRLCFACDRKLGRNPALVITSDGQTGFIGSECLRFVVKAGPDGWQPPNGGPRLKRLTGQRSQQEIAQLRAQAANK